MNGLRKYSAIKLKYKHAWRLNIVINCNHDKNALICWRNSMK